MAARRTKKEAAPVSTNTIVKELQTHFSKTEDAVIIEDYLKEDPIVGWVSTGSMMVDMAIGFPKGLGLPLPAVVEIVGQEGSAKSVMAYTLMANIQQMGGWGMLIDTEASFNHGYVALSRLDVSEGKFLYLQLDKIEECFDAIKLVIERHFAQAPGVPLCIVLDSVAGTSTAQEQEAKGEPARAVHARIIRRELRKGLPRVMNNHPVLVVFTNHLTATMATNPWQPSFESFGGSGLKFGSRVRLQLDRKSVTRTRKEDPVPSGIRCKAKVIKNKVAPPFREVEFDLRFSHGLEDYYPVMFFLEEFGKLPKSSNRYVWHEKSYWPIQLRDHMIEHQDEWIEMKKLCLDVAEQYWTESPMVPKRVYVVAPDEPEGDNDED